MGNKPAAIIAPMKHVAEVVEKKPPMILKKRIEENNKPLRKRITAPEPESEEEKLKSFEKPFEKQSATEKKARKRITGPDDQKPQIQIPVSSSIPVVTTQEVCKFWPRCKRGTSCLCLHP